MGVGLLFSALPISQVWIKPKQGELSEQRCWPWSGFSPHLVAHWLHHSCSISVSYASPTSLQIHDNLWDQPLAPTIP